METCGRTASRQLVGKLAGHFFPDVGIVLADLFNNRWRQPGRLNRYRPALLATLGPHSRPSLSLGRCSAGTAPSLTVNPRLLATAIAHAGVVG